MATFTIRWRQTPTGDIWEQDVAAKDLQAAKARWRRFWSLRIRDMAEFAATEAE